MHCQTTYVKISMTLAKWKARRKIDKCRVKEERYGGKKSVNVTKQNKCPYYCGVRLSRCAVFVCPDVVWPMTYWACWVEIYFYLLLMAENTRWFTQKMDCEHVKSAAWACVCLYSGLSVTETQIHADTYINHQTGKLQLSSPFKVRAFAVCYT